MKLLGTPWSVSPLHYLATRPRFHRGVVEIVAWLRGYHCTNHQPPGFLLIYTFPSHRATPQIGSLLVIRLHFPHGFFKEVIFFCVVGGNAFSCFTHQTTWVQCTCAQNNSFGGILLADINWKVLCSAMQGSILSCPVVPYSWPSSRRDRCAMCQMSG